VIEEKEKTAKK